MELSAEIGCIVMYRRCLGNVMNIRWTGIDCIIDVDDNAVLSRGMGGGKVSFCHVAFGRVCFYKHIRLIIRLG